MKKIFIMTILLAIMLTGCKKGETTITAEEASTKAIEFINGNFMKEGDSAELIESVEEGNLFKVKVKIPGGQEIDTYMTKDGKTFFPQAFELDKAESDESQPAANNQSPTTQVATKSDKPKVELFVMSHCPYGTQIEKGIIPVIETLGDKIDFELKFVDYAMHDKIEIDEQLEQYCVQKEAPDKLIGYLNCFLADGDTGDACFAKAGINKSTIDSCVASADKEFKVTENYNDKNTYKGRFPGFNVDKDANTKYGVGGSPTLVVNGAKAQSGRDSASLLSTICSAFNNAPEECSKQLSSAAPSPGFGAGTAGGGGSAAAGCGQ